MYLKTSANIISDLIETANSMLNNISSCEDLFSKWKEDVIILIKRRLDDSEAKLSTFEKSMRYGGSVNGWPDGNEYYRIWLKKGIALLEAWKTEIEHYGERKEVSSTETNLGQNGRVGQNIRFFRILSGIAYGLLAVLSLVFFITQFAGVRLLQRNKVLSIVVCILVFLIVYGFYDDQNRLVTWKIIVVISVISGAIQGLAYFISWAQ